MIILHINYNRHEQTETTHSFYASWYVGQILIRYIYNGWKSIYFENIYTYNGCPISSPNLLWGPENIYLPCSFLVKHIASPWIYCNIIVVWQLALNMIRMQDFLRLLPSISTTNNWFLTKHALPSYINVTHCMWAIIYLYG